MLLTSRIAFLILNSLSSAFRSSSTRAPPVMKTCQPENEATLKTPSLYYKRYGHQLISTTKDRSARSGLFSFMAYQKPQRGPTRGPRCGFYYVSLVGILAEGFERDEWIITTALQHQLGCGTNKIHIAFLDFLHLGSNTDFPFALGTDHY